MDFEGCSDRGSDPVISRTENGRTFRIRNAGRGKVAVVRVDGCLIRDGERCDYLFELGDDRHCAVYVELKGADIAKAVRQLEATMAQLTERHRRATRVCHVVASRVPRAGPAIQILKRGFYRSHGVHLHVATTQAEIDTDREPYRKS